MNMGQPEGCFSSKLPPQPPSPLRLNLTPSSRGRCSSRQLPRPTQSDTRASATHSTAQTTDGCAHGWSERERASSTLSGRLSAMDMGALPIAEMPSGTVLPDGENRVSAVVQRSETPLHFGDFWDLLATNA